MVRKSTENILWLLLVIIVVVFILSNFVFGQTGINIINNGEFDNNKSSWAIKKVSNANASITVSDESILSGVNCLRIEIIEGADSLKDVRINQVLPLQQGRYYTISFLAVANKSAIIQPVFLVSNTNQSTIWEGSNLEVTENMKHYGPFEFKCEQNDASRVFAFLVGGQDSIIIWIDSVIVEKSDNKEHLRPEEVFTDSLSNILTNLGDKTDDNFLKLHFTWMNNVLTDEINQLQYDSKIIETIIPTFTDNNISTSPQVLSSYLERKRPFIISWISPTDGRLSFSWMLPPTDWNPEQTYPLYVMLHGLWNVADNPFVYLSHFFTPDNTINEPYEDGYLLLPWGRGNLWYRGISETDVWECINYFETLVKIDSTRKYLTGHSMGGYGAWNISVKSTDVWAAVGIQAGALDASTLSSDVEYLKNIPVIFMCGDQDGFTTVNQQAYNLLTASGNVKTEFATFSGGHEYEFENAKKVHEYMTKWTKETTTSTGKTKENKPAGYRLNNNFPNPFNPETTISYELPVKSNVEIKIYDLLGKEISTLLNKQQEAGRHEIKFYGSEYDLSSGTYIYKMMASSDKEEFVKTNKMLLLK